MKDTVRFDNSDGYCIRYSTIIPKMSESEMKSLKHAGIGLPMVHQVCYAIPFLYKTIDQALYAMKDVVAYHAEVRPSRCGFRVAPAKVGIDLMIDYCEVNSGRKMVEYREFLPGKFTTEVKIFDLTKLDYIGIIKSFSSVSKGYNYSKHVVKYREPVADVFVERNLSSSISFSSSE